MLKSLDSRFRGNDEIKDTETFCESVMFEGKNFGGGADSLPANYLLTAQEFNSKLEENLHFFRWDDVFHNTKPES